MIVKSEGKELPDRCFEEGWRISRLLFQGAGNDKGRDRLHPEKACKKAAGGAPGFVIYHTNYSLVAVPGIPVPEEVHEADDLLAITIK